MPEGDALHRTARDLQVLVGEKLEVETPHPRARLSGVAERLDGRKLVKVEAVGKNLLLRFEDGLVLRSHLRMKGRWQVLSRNGTGSRRGMPWLVLRGPETEAVLWHGPLLELDEAHVRSLGPDILADPPEFDVMVGKFRDCRPSGRRSARRSSTSGSSQGSGTSGGPRRSGGLRSRRGGSSETSRTRSCTRVLDAAAQLMRRSLDSGLRQRAVYRQVGRPCPRCGAPIKSRGQGDANRIAYWCPECQRGDGPGGT